MIMSGIVEVSRSLAKGWCSLALRGMLGRLLPYAMPWARLQCGDPRHCPVNVDAELGLAPAVHFLLLRTRFLPEFFTSVREGSRFLRPQFAAPTHVQELLIGSALHHWTKGQPDAAATNY